MTIRALDGNNTCAEMPTFSKEWFKCNLFWFVLLAIIIILVSVFFGKTGGTVESEE